MGHPCKNTSCLQEISAGVLSTVGALYVIETIMAACSQVKLMQLSLKAYTHRTFEHHLRCKAAVMGNDFNSLQEIK